MTDENKPDPQDTDPGNEGDGGDQGDQNKPQPTPEEVKAARRLAIEKLGLEFARGGGGNSPQNVQQTPPQVPNEDFEIDLDGVDPAQAKAIKAALAKAGKVQTSAQQIAEYGMQQARRVAALEIARDLNDFEIADEVEKALAGARTPDALDISKRELVIKLREDGSFAAPKEAAATLKEAGKQNSSSKPKFDEGRGNAGNEKAALMDEIDKIDPSDPDADKKLAQLEKRVLATQERYLASMKK